MCYHPHSSGRALNEFLKSRYLNAERDRTCWESIPGMMKELWWKKAGVEANAGPHGAMQRRQEKRSEKEKWAAGRQRLSDWGCELMKKGSDLSSSVGTETSLHLNAPMEETRPYRAPSQSFVPNLQFPILSGWAAALNFNEEKLKILPPAYFPPLQHFIFRSVSIHLHTSGVFWSGVGGSIQVIYAGKSTTALCENTQKSCVLNLVKAKVFTHYQHNVVKVWLLKVLTVK